MKYSIIIPVYNSQAILPDLILKLEQTILTIAEPNDYQIILINDNSWDNSWDVIQKLSTNHLNITGLNLSKNYGEDNCRMAGFNYAEGEIIITMDDDLQHHPQDIPALIHQLNLNNADICFGRFPIKKQVLWKNFGSCFNNLMAKILLKKPKTLYLSTFIIFKGWVKNEIIKYTGPFPYVQGLLLNITSKITQLDINHHDRPEGKGNYNLIKSLRLWLKVATGFSITPLRISSYLGFFTAATSMLYGIYILTNYLFFQKDVRGWTSLFTAILFLGGIQLIMIGILGEYIGRIHLTTNRKSQFNIHEIIHSIEWKN